MLCARGYTRSAVHRYFASRRSRSRATPGVAAPGSRREFMRPPPERYPFIATRESIECSPLAKRRREKGSEREGEIERKKRVEILEDGGNFILARERRRRRPLVHPPPLGVFLLCFALVVCVDGFVVNLTEIAFHLLSTSPALTSANNDRHFFDAASFSRS